MPTRNFLTHSLQNQSITRILNAALDGVEPGKLIQNSLSHLDATRGELFALALGKAAEPMVEALSNYRKLKDALVITKHASGISHRGIRVIEAGHPIPDERSLQAGKAALDFASRISSKDTLVCLISGGGSALASVPVSGLELLELQALTSALIRSGAAISEINILRRSLDEIKGGGLARACPGSVISLILSDVPGNSLEAIASGPTVENPTSNQDALSILKKYSVPVPDHLEEFLSSHGFARKDVQKNLVSNFIIGDLQTAAEAAQERARREGYSTQIMNLTLQGEARSVGLDLVNELKRSIQRNSRPFCLIAGGETTVKVEGNGSGGRNQEIALAAVKHLAGIPDIFFITLATDGEDGPTDAAGAVVTGSSLARAQKLGLDPGNYLARNDSYSFFAALRDLLQPGPTGTNVNDLAFMIGL